MSMQRMSALLVFSLLLCKVNAIYTPLREYAGETFFDKWAYYGNVDNTTWGNVTFLDQPNAVQKGLTYINGAGNAVVKVDNTTTIEPAPLIHRDSIRLTSLDSYGIGSLIIIDAVHIPYGCSVWPSFWTLGIQKEWPQAGEIDVIESINDLDHNQVALHTTGGCFQAKTPGQTGVTIETDCSTGRGCLVAETKPNSFGSGFAQAGGGVFALQMAPTGIYSWFWSRNDIPSNVKDATSSSEIDTGSWGIPTAAYPSSGCDIEKHFPPQNLILLTTLCGVWAGVPSIYKSTCHASKEFCVNDVIGPGNKFDTAYWEIQYIRAYQYTNSSNQIPISTPNGNAGISTPKTVTTVITSTTDSPTPTKAPSSGYTPRSSIPLVTSSLFLAMIMLL